MPKRGRPWKTICKHGHNLSETRRQNKAGNFYCSTCRKDRERQDRLRYLYGENATPALYDELYDQQGGRCAICGAPPNGRRLGLDHDHDTGEIRGLLCVNCNSAIGKLCEEPALFEIAVVYLTRGRSG